ncbi:MAG: DUF962 domain-containing protein [Flavobacteriales bacterium]|nr:DUF962 domain-containing protein [Flavobacteriales bacterium]
MPTLQDWFDAYGESHRNPVNKAMHWICVPTIFFCTIGLLGSLPPAHIPVLGWMPWARLAVMAGLLFYLRKSLPMFIGMSIWSVVCLWVAHWLDLHAPLPLWAICLALFVAAWIGQFIGHRIEGQRPSFLKDLQFLLIGPAWLMGSIYRRFGIPY